jgi:hypothetical protein
MGAISLHPAAQKKTVLIVYFVSAKSRRAPARGQWRMASGSIAVRSSKRGIIERRDLRGRRSVGQGAAAVQNKSEQVVRV